MGGRVAPTNSGSAVSPALRALTLMVLATTFLAPPVLARVGAKGAGRGEVRDDIGIDDLVAGDWRQTTPRSVNDPGTSD